jgi:hypothetical protein
MAAATLLGEKGQQDAEALYIGGIEDASLGTPRSQQSGPFQLRQMRRQGGGRHAKTGGNLPGWQAIGGLSQEQTKNVQTAFLGQGGEGSNRVVGFHRNLKAKGLHERAVDGDTLVSFCKTLENDSQPFFISNIKKI